MKDNPAETARDIIEAMRNDFNLLIDVRDTISNSLELDRRFYDIIIDIEEKINPLIERISVLEHNCSLLECMYENMTETISREVCGHLNLLIAQINEGNKSIH